MRGLAEFIMRGRWQALSVACLGAGSLLFGWLSAAAIALVTLRKGVSQGTWLVLWASLPAMVVTWASGDASTLMVMLGAYCLAIVLRLSVSMALTITGSVVVGWLTGGGLLLFSQDFLAQLVAVFDDVMGQLESGLTAAEGQAVRLARPTVAQVAGILAAGNAGLAVVSVLLARWWQAVLYNPGGFAREFQGLRLPVVWTLLLTLGAAGLWLSSPVMSGWSAVLMVPLTFCGLALVHARAALRGRGRGWLTGFYALWLLLDPVKVVLLGLVVVDAIVDFRSRWQADGSSGAQ